MLLPLLLNNLLAAAAPPPPPPPPPPATNTTGSNQRRPQLQWLPAHTPWVAPLPRRRPRKKRDAELLFLGH